MEEIAKKNGFSLHQKNYQDGKNYSQLSKAMKDQAILFRESKKNISQKFFIDSLKEKFPIA